MSRFIKTTPRIAVASTVIFALATVARPSRAKQPPLPAPIFPKPLAAGDTILYIAPAKYLDKPRTLLAKRRLEQRGFNVRLPKTLFRKQGYLAGSDHQRAAELMAAFADPDVDAIFPGTGGYGATRILDKLDYDVIRRNPKIFIGFSDVTALHVAINQRTGLVTFHSPNPEYGLGNDDDLTPFAATWFWRAILVENYRDAVLPGYTIATKSADLPPSVTLRDGQARGRLIGGNLSVVHALMGTPFEIRSDGKILFLEDVGEAPYRVDRMLCTLKLAGKFDHLAGVLLGCFTRREDEDPWDDDMSMEDVLRDYFADLGVPVLMQFPVGHVPYNTTLPIGCLAELDATRGTIRLLENPVQLPQ